jgi:hypothetical protein
MYNIEPIEVSHAYSINSTAFVVEATYHPDESFSKSLMIVIKTEEETIPSNHAQLLEMALRRPEGVNEYDHIPNFDPQFALMRTKNSDYSSGQHLGGVLTGTRHLDDNPEREI